MRPLAPLFVLALVACAPATDDTDDTDTDTDAGETDDTEPVDVDASGWQVDPEATQRFAGTLVAETGNGEQERDVNFAMPPATIAHAVVPLRGENFRTLIGAVQANLQVGENVVATRFEMRLIVPEDIQETGTFDCRGSDRYAVTLGIVAVGQDAANGLAFSSNWLDPEDDTRPCTVTITRHTLQRVTAEVDVAWMLSPTKNREGENLAGRVEDLVVDVILREKPANAAEE